VHPQKHVEPPVERRLRVRFRRLEQLDETKLALALALMAKRLVEAEKTADEAGRSDDEVVERRREVA
jgi:hypothetical protein